MDEAPEAEPIVAPEKKEYPHFDELVKQASSDGAITAGYMRVSLKSKLFELITQDYLYDCLSMRVKLFFPGQESAKELQEREASVEDPYVTYVPVYLPAKEDMPLEAEFNPDTIRKCFIRLGIVQSDGKTATPASQTVQQETVVVKSKASDGSTKQVSTFSIVPGTRGIYANRGPQTPDEWKMASLAIMPDADLIEMSSAPFAELCQRKSDPSKSNEQLFCEWFKHMDARIKNVGDNVFSSIGCVISTPNKQRRFGRFLGGVNAIGITGRGLAFIIGSVARGDGKWHVYEAQMARLDPPRGGLKPAQPPEGAQPKDDKGQPKQYVEFDLESADPCWREFFYKNDKPFVLRAAPHRVAVSPDRHPDAPSVAALIVPSSAGSSEFNVYVLGVATLNGSRRGSVLCSVLPCQPSMPTFMIVSSRMIVLVCCRTSVIDPKTGNEELLAPFIYAREFALGPFGHLQWHGNEWEMFELPMPVLPPLERAPKQIEAMLKDGRIPAFSSGAFDKFDPYEAFFGTYDGILVNMQFYHATAASLDCRVRPVAPYITPSYKAELEAIEANLKKLEKPPTEEEAAEVYNLVGAFRRPITWIEAGATKYRYKGDDLQHTPELSGHELELCKSRLVCVFPNGYAWEIGDHRVADSVQARDIRANAKKVTTSAYTCATSIGSLLVLHNYADQGIEFVDMRTNHVVGRHVDPRRGGGVTSSDTTNKDLPHYYSSLWADVGIVGILYPDGELGFIMPATEEKLKERDEEIKRLEELRAKEQERLRKEMEEIAVKTAQLKIEKASKEAEENKKKQQQQNKPDEEMSENRADS